VSQASARHDGNNSAEVANARSGIMNNHTSILNEQQLDSVSGGDNTTPISNMGVLSPGGDIAEMCFVVLMEGTNDQNKDLALIMRGRIRSHR
jgi:hypothetical protein